MMPLTHTPLSLSKTQISIRVLPLPLRLPLAILVQTALHPRPLPDPPLGTVSARLTALRCPLPSPSALLPLLMVCM